MLTDHRLSKCNPLRGISDDVNAKGANKPKRPTHKQHGKPRGLNKPKRQRDSNSKGLESREKDRMDRRDGKDRCYIFYRCDRGLRIDIIDGMGWIGGFGG